MMLIAVLELSFHAKYHRREKFLGAPGGTILGLMVCGLMLTLAPCTTKTSAGEKKDKSLLDPGKHIYSGREVFTLRLLRLSRDVPDCYRSLFGPSERKSACSLFPPFPVRLLPS